MNNFLKIILSITTFAPQLLQKCEYFSKDFLQFLQFIIIKDKKRNYIAVIPFHFLFVKSFYKASTNKPLSVLETLATSFLASKSATSGDVKIPPPIKSK